MPKEAQSSLLLLRLREILSRLARRGDTQLMNEDLRELAQRDSRAMEESLGLVRAAIWVLPLLGVLGMLYRIASVLQVVSGLGSDFAPSLVMGISYGLDCLVLALACSVVNILALGPAHHAQRQLVARLDCLLDQLILPMFPKQTGAAGAVDSAALGEMMERMLDAIEHTARVQTDVWQQAMVTAQRHWQLTVETAGDQVQAALREAIEASLMKHAAEVDRAQHAGIEAIDRRWRQWQNVLSDNARALTTQQKLLTEHGEYLKAATERSEELSTLREALNQNLVAVEQTLKTLGGTQELASAMRTLGRAVELMAVNTQAIVAASPASATRNRAAA